jgi:hypothetical protein
MVANCIGRDASKDLAQITLEIAYKFLERHPRLNAFCKPIREL